MKQSQRSLMLVSNYTVTYVSLTYVSFVHKRYTFYCLIQGVSICFYMPYNKHLYENIHHIADIIKLILIHRTCVYTRSINDAGRSPEG